MTNLIRVLVGLSALAFVLAIVVALMDPIFANIKAEGFSRASANLALIAIALHLTFDRDHDPEL